ncbi:winged helix-turn-helix domain-containing protein [Aliivibrio fischeri]|uniref:winged helix-turn-helix domain-containing protein n=1 Tax=Aliivibrio fischeri TaxID=668 RepID=UPI0012DA3505|nr:helix-turn-helix domain-containing protein [Aliivibrio fischeri]MUJ39567.1 winged helix family transcriptional regulator [Aliivibrio fischeri]
MFVLIDKARRQLSFANPIAGFKNQTIELNRSEFNLLLAFIESIDVVIDKNHLIEQGWPGRIVGENSLAVAIMKLRKKLEELSDSFEINNLPGEGYVFLNPKKIEFSFQNEKKHSQMDEKQNDEITESLLNKPHQKQKSAFQSVQENLKCILPQPLYALFSTKLFWEVTIALLFGFITFYMIYQEAFECFDCFGVTNYG